ncbi:MULTISPECIES: class I adenylate-forming enzyme family protein [unclassified Pseudomonas]|uniref:class I adenylate-forming enzyme family protein n=1 Tax=unclassified Pseudomonas TaxID=196821 RepID=UPI000D38CCB6|nr:MULTISPECIES: class I adenylate-forming enzyme family protein [unclassified Pseudomonas]PTR23744.1 acyl-CoA synthetase (AMP-forming)/AMP-acid ligase II [Pseudomonas sp. GV085]
MKSLTNIGQREDFISPGQLENISTTASVGERTDVARLYRQYIAYWLDQSLPAGQVVLIAVPNSPDLLAMFAAVLNSNHVPALIAPTTPGDRVMQMVRDFGAGALIRSATHDATWESYGVQNVQDLGRWQVGRVQNAPLPITQPGQVVIATSGTSRAFSSGCVHWFSALQNNALRHARSIGLGRTDRILVNLPMYYSTALVAQTIAALELGAHLVISGPPFLVPTYLEDIHEHRITASSVTPVLLRQINAHSQSLPGCLRLLTVGGDLAAATEVNQCLTANPGLELYLTYGISEAGPRVSTCAAHRASPQQLSSVGLPLEGTQVMILRPSPDSAEGELLVSSDTLLTRKIGQDSHTPIIELNGKRWLKTGDIFSQDHDGYLYFKGRHSDFIVIRDEKVNLGAIKQMCKRVPGVLACRTEVVSDSSVPAGFQLELTVDRDVVQENEGDYFKTRLLKQLKHYERPLAIALLHRDALSMTNHK